MEPGTLSSYLLVFRDCWRLTQRNSPREIGMVLSQWIEWHDSLDAQGKIRFRGAIGQEISRLQRPIGIDRYPVKTDKINPIVGYLIIDAASLDEAMKIAASCPGLDYGFAVDICRPFVTE